MFRKNEHNNSIERIQAVTEGHGSLSFSDGFWMFGISLPTSFESFFNSSGFGEL